MSEIIYLYIDICFTGTKSLVKEEIKSEVDVGEMCLSQEQNKVDDKTDQVCSVLV